MPHENKKIYMPPKCTGTIPKVKQRNNNNASAGTDHRSNLVSNNLATNECEVAEPSTDHYRNQNRNLHLYHSMDMNQEVYNQNGITTNGIAVTPNESQSQSTSRRSSAALSKCDNVAKYPDKKQIENKLSQIQEYLQVATSMRANMKKTDEQMEGFSLQSQNNLNDDEALDADQLDAIIKDLVDSEIKLKTILNDFQTLPQYSEPGSDQVDHERNKNELERKVDVATRDLQMLKEHENFLLHMQLNAENQLREAKYAQAKLARAATSRNANSETDGSNDFEILSLSGASSGRNIDLRELEERIKSFHVDETKTQPDQFQGQIDLLQNHIHQMRDGNDNRSQLIQILDTRDAQLQAQHSSLQSKLQELQNKKNQVDQLVVQLQNMNEDPEEEAMGCHVKKIVNMKEQLTKLKDMLTIVETTENSLSGQDQDEGIPSEIEENVNRLIAKTDNMMQQNRVPHVENIENASSRSQFRASSNERHLKEKQVNKKSMNANERERISLQAELRSKRQELEELMCKHKAANSNLNHDVNSEKNSEMGASSNTFFDATNAWYPMDSNIFNTNVVEQQSSESDDCPEEDPNEYSVLNASNEINTPAVQPMPVLNFPTANYIRKRSHETPRVEIALDSYLPSSRSPARSVRSATPVFPAHEASSIQIQKQLELIKTVCDSMLESTHSERTEQTVPVRVRNNLTPSPIYSEPRNCSQRPNANNGSMANGLNVVSCPEGCNNVPILQTMSPHDAAAYNNWLTTNSLQTQAFILNTLNQCCQMLWHQQKELSTLRSTVNVMQDRFGSVYHEEGAPMCMQSNPCIYQPNLPNMPPHHSNTNYLPNNFRHQMKTNHLPSSHHQGHLNSGSMPNLNGHCAYSATNNGTNLEHAAYCNNTLLNNNVAGNLHQHQNVISEHQVNTNHIMHHNQNVPNPIWNGQALNNQVPPGNRANNYWDNFRSYSRQNLFSTKSNDGTQNLTNERSNQSSDRHRSANYDATIAANPATGLSTLFTKSNSNQNDILATSTSAENSPRRPRRIPMAQTSISSLHSSPSSAEIKSANGEDAFALPIVDLTFSPPNANRNEWSNESATSKSKLFEDLRENVYKEVASLISSNEGRPHFLIQLFRDLQLVHSEPMRRNILQSVQSIITSSLTSADAVASMRQQLGNEADNPRPNENYPITEEINNEFQMLMHPNVHDISGAPSEGNMSDTTDNSQQEAIFSSIWPVMSNRGISEEILDENLASYMNRVNCEEPYLDSIVPATPTFDTEEAIPRLQIFIQNGDLAEADQSRVVDEEDEGAVGGLFNILERSSSSNDEQINFNEISLETEDESLDQVPTRLSNPPSIGCSPKSQ